MTPAERRSILADRAAAHPDGLPTWKLTHGFPKVDALQFWNDAAALGLVKVGETERGARTFAFPGSTRTDAVAAAVDPL